MQLYKLDSDFLLADLIEGYDSLIWTERYRPAGEFELKTAIIQQTMLDLPLGSLVSLLDTKEMMWVEDHKIETDNSGAQTLTVTGRSFEVFYENRTTLSSTLPSHASPITNATSGENNAVNISSSTSPAAAVITLQQFGGAIGYIDTKDDLADVIMVNTVPSTGLPVSQRYMERGSTYEVVLKILEENDDGIRNTRAPTIAANSVTEVYHGLDRSATIILDARAGHFENPSYFWSIRDYKDVVYVASQKDFVQVGATTSDLDRRVGLLELPEMTATGATVPAMLTAKGKAYLNQHKKVALIDGAVSANIPFSYNVDYFLGDTIKCLGDYDISVNMMVVEYIRVEDENGETAYPTLSV